MVGILFLYQGESGDREAEGGGGRLVQRVHKLDRAAWGYVNTNYQSHHVGRQLEIKYLTIQANKSEGSAKIRSIVRD